MIGINNLELQAPKGGIKWKVYNQISLTQWPTGSQAGAWMMRDEVIIQWDLNGTIRRYI